MTLTEEIQIADQAGKRAGWRGWAALVVLMLPVLLVSIDNTVLAFAIPEISAHLRPTGAEQLWIVDAYPLVLAGLLVTMGTLGDRFGRRRMLLIGAVGFAAVSAAAAFATSAALLIVARAAMGVFGAMLMPSTLSLLRSIFTDRQQRRLAIAIWASMFAAGSALGPIVGGFLLEHFSWGSVFLMAVPVLVPLVILAPLLVPESRDPMPGRIDPLSILLSLGAMVPIVYAIKEIAVHGFSWLVAILVIVGVAAGFAFVRRQLSAAIPMLDMRLFARRSFSGGVTVNLLSVVGLVGFLYFASQNLQLVQGLSPMNAGLGLIPGVAIMMISGIAVVPIVSRVSPRLVAPIALSLAVIGYVLVALPFGHGTVAGLIAAFAFIGAGVGAAETISNDLILASAPPAKAGAASAVSETAYELGAVLGTTVLGGILTAAYRATLEIPAGVPTDAAEASRETLAGAMEAASGLPTAIGQALHDAASAAFESGVALTAGIGAVLVLIAAIIASATFGTHRSATSASASDATAGAPTA